MEQHNLEPYSNNAPPEKQYSKEEAYLRAKAKVKRIMGFYGHLASYLVVNLILVIIIVANGGKLLSFGTFATALFWGIGLLFHFLAVFGPDFLFGKNWEQRKIKEFMENEQNKQQFN